MTRINPLLALLWLLSGCQPDPPDPPDLPDPPDAPVPLDLPGTETPRNGIGVTVAQLAEIFRTASDLAPIRVLVMTRTHGYRHGPAIETAHTLLSALNETTEFRFEFTETVDDFNKVRLAEFDLLFLANSTLRVDRPDPDALPPPAQPGSNRQVKDPLTAEHRSAIIDFLARGGGIAGAHSALDALYGWNAYRELVGGGLFQSHPWTQEVRIRIEAPASPAVSHLGTEFTIKDEIYVLDRNPRPNVQVLASLDTGSVNVGLNSADPARTDFPISWLGTYQGGRVFITKLGHFPEVWTNPAFIAHLLQGMRLAAGRIEERQAS
jgi:type 1 glutamine amidotransferase